MDELFITFNYIEANIILNWFEIANVRSERFGSSRYFFPQEEVVVQKLRRMDPASKYDDIDFEILWGWMERAVFPRLGDGGIYFPNEEETVNKLHEFRKKVDKMNSLDRQKRIIKSRIEASEHSQERHEFKYDADTFRQKLKEKEKLKEHIVDEQISGSGEKLDKIRDKHDPGRTEEKQSSKQKTDAVQHLKENLKTSYKKLFSKGKSDKE